MSNKTCPNRSELDLSTEVHQPDFYTTGTLDPDASRLRPFMNRTAGGWRPRNRLSNAEDRLVGWPYDFENAIPSIGTYHMILEAFLGGERRPVVKFEDSESFSIALSSFLASEPVEDGVSHPAEGLIQDLIEAQPVCALHWIKEYLDLNVRPAIAAGAVQCLGRIPFKKVRVIAHDIIAWALSHSSTEVREAAISCIEQWEDPSLIGLLKKHDDHVPWLNDYSQMVIGDLQLK